MLLSEMFGVERDTDFRVKGYETRFRLTLNVSGFEHLKIKRSGSDVWETPLIGTIFNVISVAPSGIIHLSRPLTDEQREQLQHIYGLGGRYIAKDKFGFVYAFSARPKKGCVENWLLDDNELFLVFSHLSVCSLVSWSDPEPYDIAKALEVEG